ncbi:low molecular weight phosphotyrosine protein phosphatase [Echinicola soli]|uniref:Low molecular weight phosphotyrosine protein phosphatase n=1 Tax=Echinicola soli TaxID=2591634 RepID=A0A514CH68_9BACT|nr:low molecular weight protein-tyrosine-phosphatase [Echinicola soli]QDH79148.1 low molecular weight phosphotyrosine protein phosphatase [Echinicola soli]
MIKVLFVCLGNICRSPLAEAIFNHQINELELNHKFQSDSCGTSDYHIGELPDERSMASAKKHGIAISHRGRQLNHADIRDFDYIIAMDSTNKKNIIQLMESYNLSHDRIYLMRDFQSKASSKEVPDPYYGGEDGFENVYQILNESIQEFIVQLKKEHQVYA